MEIFEQLLDQYEPMIYSCMRKLHIYKNQDLFAQVGRVGLWHAWQRYDESKGDFAPFAYRSIYGSLLDELKKASKEENHIPTEHQILELIANPQMSHSDWSEGVLVALSQLNRKEKQLIQLLFIDCCSLDEVALHVGISKAGVKKRRERTLEKLKHILLETKK
ncbi:sigma-70 family RNA polymerase sigma factor [Paenisporosarcina indica]|uniref:sigma-70 family RNA polymerase sigma factor n=1 Tax=Paenisporosarcina indica TaxID=650093 RepID=UPI00094F608C|nr:sigma-70 family RNA polymerase sigma factor [Paenisporosarcina indica]